MQIMRLDVWLAFQWVEPARAMLISAGIDPWKRGLGLDFHPRTCGSRPKFGLLACAELFRNRTGYFNRLVEIEVTDRAFQIELATRVGRLAGQLELAICL